MAKIDTHAGVYIFLYEYIDGLVQDCSNSIANALELLQSCTKPTISLYSIVANSRWTSAARSPVSTFTSHDGSPRPT